MADGERYYFYMAHAGIKLIDPLKESQVAAIGATTVPDFTSQVALMDKTISEAAPGSRTVEVLVMGGALADALLEVLHQRGMTATKSLFGGGFAIRVEVAP